MTVTTIGAGSDTLALGITENTYQGDAQFTVSVDNQQVGGVLTATSPHDGASSDTVNVLGDWAPGSHTVTVNFLNDAWDGTPETDRNLFLDGATYNGAFVPRVAQELQVSGPVSFGVADSTALGATDQGRTVTWSSGTTEASLFDPPLAPGDVLVVKGDATVIAEGDQLAGVSVDLAGAGSNGTPASGVANLALSSATVGSFAVSYDPNGGPSDLNSAHFGHLDVYGQTTITGSTTVGGSRPFGPGFLDAYVHGSDGVLTLDGASIEGDSTLTINGDQGATVENDGNISVQGGANVGSVAILASLQGTGTISGGTDFAGDTASIRLGGDVGEGQTIDLTQANLELDQPMGFAGTLAGFNSGRDSGVTLADETVTGTSFQQLSDGVGDLSVFTQDQDTGAAGATLVYHVAGNFASDAFAFTNSAATQAATITLAPSGTA